MLVLSSCQVAAIRQPDKHHGIYHGAASRFARLGFKDPNLAVDTTVFLLLDRSNRNAHFPWDPVRFPLGRY
jgi:hypothetical protein